MKALNKMFNCDKGKLLADLFPEELKNITDFLENAIQDFLINEEKVKEDWKPSIISVHFWYRLIGNINSALHENGKRIYKIKSVFVDQLFDGYDALVTIHCLLLYANNEQCDPKLKRAIHLIFGTEELISNDRNN